MLEFKLGCYTPSPRARALSHRRPGPAVSSFFPAETPAPLLCAATHCPLPVDHPDAADPLLSAARPPSRSHTPNGITPSRWRDPLPPRGSRP